MRKHIRGAWMPIAMVVALGLLSQSGSAATKHRVAVFGSSVASGTGDELGHEGYTGRLRDLLAPRGWEVFNQSRGGDNTLTMAPRFAVDGEPRPNTKYLMSVNPDYVLLGLSLGNEGIKNGTTTAEKDAIFAQFERGMRGFVTRSRENHVVPIITLCYTRNDFTDVEYAYTRRMNILINGWDVPSANFLGAVDDGTGKWAKGFWWDSLHPNASGHDELTATIVPTLFDALEAGKPLPKKSTATGFARVTGGKAPIAFTPADKTHPFAVSVDVRAQADGTVLTVSGKTLTATTATKSVPRGRGAAVELKETTLTPAVPFNATVGIAGGVWAYTGADGVSIRSTVKADGAWHQIVVSHYTARGETLFFVDGALAGHAAERLEPTRFVAGGPDASGRAAAPKEDLKELMIYRSALNADEVAALAKGTLLQASLEVYAPLADATFPSGKPVQNLAQATTAAVAGDGVAVHAEK